MESLLSAGYSGYTAIHAPSVAVFMKNGAEFNSRGNQPHSFYAMVNGLGDGDGFE